MKIYFSYSSQSEFIDQISMLSDGLSSVFSFEVLDSVHLQKVVSREPLEEIRSCDVLLVAIDKAGALSDRVRREVDFARGARLSVMPIIFDTGPDSGDVLRRFALQDRHYHMFSKSDHSIQRLGRNIMDVAEHSRKQKMKEGIMDFNPIFGEPSFDAQFRCDVFMVMPFAEDFQPIYTDHIIPLIDAKNLEIKRGDDFFAKHSIMTDIWSAIFASNLVIGDCTGQNANVFYELGIAHTLGRPTILITQDLDDIPFDLRHLRIIQYEYTPPGMKKFEEKLADAIEKLL